MESERVAHTAESEEALRESLFDFHYRAVLHSDTSVGGARFSPDGKLIAAMTGGKLHVWEVSTGRSVAVLSWSMRIGMYKAEFSPDSKFLVAVGWDGTTWGGIMLVWDTGTWVLLANLHDHVDAVHDVAFSSDGKFAITTSDDKTARVWDTKTWRSLTVLHGHTSGVMTAEFSSDSRFIVTSSPNEARVWEVATGRTIAELAEQSDYVESAVFSPDERFVVTVSRTKNYTARLWNVEEGRAIAEFNLGDANLVTSVHLSPDGRFIVTTSYDQTAAVWEVSTGKRVSQLRGHTYTVWDAAFSPDGKFVVTASEDKTARVWDAMTGQSIVELRGDTYPLGGAAFSQDSKFVATTGGCGLYGGCDNTVRIWDIWELGIWPLSSVTNKAVSPDGRFVAAMDNLTNVSIKEIGTGKTIILHGHTDYVNTVVFSPDGKFIVSASGDGTARVWEASTGREVFILRGHTNSVLTAIFSPDGKQILTGSEDGTARVWDATTGQLLSILGGHTGAVVQVAFSADGKQIFTWSAPGKLTSYFINFEDLNALARTRVAREFTCQERQTYLHDSITCPTPTATPTPNLNRW